MASLESFKAIFAILVLLYASYLDWRYREIDNKSWLSMVVAGLIFAIYCGAGDVTPLVSFLISVVFTSVLVGALYYLGILSGGDGKILVGISALIPEPQKLTLFPIFSLSVFTNAIVLSSMLPFLFFAYNIKNLKEVKTARDFVALFLGYKKKGYEVKSHEAIFGEEGDYKFFINARKAELGKKVRRDAWVWVTPAIPFVIPITAGFIISMLFGDIISYILINIRGIG